MAWHDFRTDAIYNPAGTGKSDRSEARCWNTFSVLLGGAGGLLLAGLLAFGASLALRSRGG